MNKIIQSLIKEVVHIEISGNKILNGVLVEIGGNIIVLFDGLDFMYIPIPHIQMVRLVSRDENDVQNPIIVPSNTLVEEKLELSYDGVLSQAKGKLMEIYITGDQSLHGYITTIKKDYFEFYSPIYKSMFIAKDHVKWLIPIPQNETLYALNPADSIIKVDNDTLAETYQVQITKLLNSLVVLNVGGNRSYSGKINKVEDKLLEIQRARKNPINLNIDHIKTLHRV